MSDAVNDPKEGTKQVRYTIAEVLDAINTQDWLKMAKMARIYPALVTALVINPVATVKSLWGDRSARGAEYRLRSLLAFTVEETSGDDTRASNPETLPPAPAVRQGDIDEVKSLLSELEQQDGTKSEDDPE